MTDRLNELHGIMLSKCVDKEDAKRRFHAIEKNVRKYFFNLQIKNIYELMIASGYTGQAGGCRSRDNSEDEAMFSKRPLGGMSCGSCERSLVNITGQMAEYKPWRKLPFREPHDRIAKVSHSL